MRLRIVLMAINWGSGAERGRGGGGGMGWGGMSGGGGGGRRAGAGHDSVVKNLLEVQWFVGSMPLGGSTEPFVLPAILEQLVCKAVVCTQ